MSEGEHTDTRLAEVEARIQEIERRMESDRERLKELRATALRLSKEEGESLSRQVVMSVLKEADGAVDKEQLVAECTDIGASEGPVRDALETLKRRGEIYVPREGEVRQT
jgi:DNA replicative helicase MCM subunit Mcm2 (Cdc46/Mcm family)